jgi:hypothetical protein
MSSTSTMTITRDTHGVLGVRFRGAWQCLQDVRRDKTSGSLLGANYLWTVERAENPLLFVPTLVPKTVPSTWASQQVSRCRKEKKRKETPFGVAFGAGVRPQGPPCTIMQKNGQGGSSSSKGVGWKSEIEFSSLRRQRRMEAA